MTGTAQPIYFGAPERPLFGWLHLPAGQHSGIGLVICKPLGYEDICGHRSNRHLALAAAAHGIAALNFDYDGSGDSAGTDADPDRVNAWIESIRTAIDALRRATGVHAIHLAGVRLGGSLALLAAQGRADVAGVVAINPVIEGRRYLRELRALAAAGAPAGQASPGGGDDLQAVAGFVTTAQTREALSALRLSGDSLQNAPARALLMHRTDLPLEEDLAQRLTALGCDVTRAPFEGYAEMLRDAHETVVPHSALQALLHWVGKATPSAGVAQHASDIPPSGRMFPWISEAASGQIREQAVLIDAHCPMFGIVSEPARPAATGARPALLLLNSGAVHHIGPNRLYVRIARHFALQGFKVLRLDMPGIGDSDACTAAQENEVYPANPERLVAPAIRYLRSQPDVGAIHCAGICSGAYHGLKSAVAGAGLATAIVINPLTYFWKPHMSLAAPAYQDTAEMMRYRQTSLSLASWKKLVKGQVDLINLARTLGRHFTRRISNTGRAVARSLGIRLQDDLVAELRSARDHGTHIRFVFARRDPGYSMLCEQAGRQVARLLKSGAITIDFIEGADHTFTPYPSQMALLDTLHRLLVDRSGSPGA